MPPVIYERSEITVHKAEYISLAAILQLVITAVVIVIPIVIVYRSEGFWKKESTYREQPSVLYKNEFFLLLHTKNTQDNLLVWSSFDAFNELHREYVRLSSISYFEEDWNYDGVNDRFRAEISVPLQSAEEIYGFDLFLVFSYNLKTKSRLRMETLVHVGHNSALSGSGFYLNGDLRLYLRQPLFHRGVDKRYDVELFNNRQMFTQGLDLFSFYDEYAKRNVSTYIGNAMPIWTPGRTESQPFTIKLTLNFMEELIWYQCGFWELMKWAWVQYISILLIFNYVFTRIRRYIFTNQLIPTIVMRPFRDDVAASATSKLQLSS